MSVCERNSIFMLATRVGSGAGRECLPSDDGRNETQTRLAPVMSFSVPASTNHRRTALAGAAARAMPPRLGVLEPNGGAARCIPISHPVSSVLEFKQSQPR